MMYEYPLNIMGRTMSGLLYRVVRVQDEMVKGLLGAVPHVRLWE